MNLALLALHVVVGLLFAGHGAQKLFGAFGGGGLRGTAEMFEGIGLRPGSLHARAAGALELVGGSLLALGLFTPFAAAGLIAVMTAAVLTVWALGALAVGLLGGIGAVVSGHQAAASGERRAKPAAT
jgi:putative oxidoreductase